MKKQGREVVLWFVVLAFIFVFSGSCWAKTGSRGKAWLYVESSSETPSWMTSALSSTVSYFLSSNPQISVDTETKLSDGDCEPGERECILRLLAERDVDIAILGRLDQRRLVLESFESQSRALIANEEIKFRDNISMDELRRRIFQLVRPFTRTDGLLDQKSSAFAKARDVQPIGIAIVGALWAFAALSILRFVFPLVKRTEDLNHLTLFPFLRLWMARALVRFVLLSVVLVPAFYFTNKGVFRAPLWALPCFAAFVAWGLNVVLRRAHFKAGSLLEMAPIDVAEIAGRRETKTYRLLVPAIAALVLVALTGTSVVAAFRYHPVYVKHMEEMKKKERSRATR